MAAAPCRCRKKNLMERRLRFADIPEAFREMRLGTFRVDVYREPEQKKKALAACRMVKEYLGMFREAEENGIVPVFGDKRFRKDADGCQHSK